MGKIAHMISLQIDKNILNGAKKKNEKLAKQKSSQVKSNKIE